MRIWLIVIAKALHLLTVAGAIWNLWVSNISLQCTPLVMNIENSAMLRVSSKPNAELNSKTTLELIIWFLSTSTTTQSSKDRG